MYVFNKCDRESCDTINLMGVVANKLSTQEGKRAVYISALTGQGCDDLAAAIRDIIRRGKRQVTFVIPNAEQGALSRLYSEKAAVESVEYGEEAVTVIATVDDRVYGLMKKYDPNHRDVREEDTW